MPIDFKVQSTLHIGIIMDGNGRWATGRGLPRILGYRAGVEAARRVVEAAPDAGVGILTLFAFSSDNWRRPPAEVDALMRLMAAYLENETARAVARGVRLEGIGLRDRPGRGRHRNGPPPTAPHGRGLLGARRHPGRRPRSARTLPRCAGTGHGTAGRPVDPHRRRAAAERFSALGIGLRRTCVHAHHVAGFRCVRPGGRAARVPRPPTPLRHSPSSAGLSPGSLAGLTWHDSLMTPAASRRRMKMRRAIQSATIRAGSELLSVHAPYRRPIPALRF